MAKQVYRLFAGEKEARAASERPYYDVSDRRRNFPDYDGSALTHKTYSDSGQSGKALGANLLEQTSREGLFENMGERILAYMESSNENGRNSLRMDEQRVLLGTDRVKAAGDEPAFSMPLEPKASGNALFKAQDIIEVVKGGSSNADENDYARLHHKKRKIQKKRNRLK